ncbi:MAG: hypothetical protein DRN15_03220 [Thermoprotei archaeon]|nr:MAG: hypothetical protein DRN15_03220 [Thermoprotei archaeon]
MTMMINELPIPSEAKRVLLDRGIVELYPPQEEAVRKGLLEGRSLVVAIPTAAGKTLIAELAMIKSILEKGGKALYLVPLRALANEKYEEFKCYERLGLRIAVSTGDYDSSDPWLSRYDIIVATNEKVDSLLRHKAEWIKDVSVVVADEIHLLNDLSRGPTLEVVLTRLRQVKPDAQVIALSATIANAEEIAEWLGAELVKSDWRPVPLREGVYCKGYIEYEDGEVHKVKDYSDYDLANLVLEIIDDGGQVLIFANTRHSAVNMARRLKGYVLRRLSPQEKKELKEIADHILREGERTSLSEALAELVAAGVAFHHAGLHYLHRKIVERAFRELHLKVVCATPTLAAGVNLPARRVIISDYRRYDPRFGLNPIPVLEYKQMAGRAGRPKYDEIGDAILMARSPEEAYWLVDEYVRAEPERIWSKLGAEPALRSHVLSLVATGFANSEERVLKFIEDTFYARQYGVHTVKETVRVVLRFLLDHNMIELRQDLLTATAFGKRVSELYIDPLSAVRIKAGLESAASSTTPLGYLHLICHTPDMPKLYLRRGERKHYLEYLEKHRDELLIKPPEDHEELLLYLSELKTALLLLDWIEEVSEDTIVRRYDVGPGDIYSLVQTAEWLVYSAREISKHLGLMHHLGSLEKLRLRIKHGVREELLELVSLKGVGRVRARMLYQAGFKTLEDLRRAKVEALIRVPMIGVEIVKSIKEQLGETIDEKGLEKIKKKEQSTLMYWLE